jgi:hypothetical protein
MVGGMKIIVFWIMKPCSLVSGESVPPPSSPMMEAAGFCEAMLPDQ